MRAARTALRLPTLPQLRTKEPKRKTMSRGGRTARSGLARRFLPGICRAYGWAGTAPRHWGSSWQPGTQKAPKAQLLRRLSGRGLRWGHCSFAQCFCAGSVSGALACWCCFLRCAGDFSASAQPPWQRLTVRQDCCATAAIRLYRMLPRCCCVCGWPDGRRSWLHNCSVPRGGAPQGKRREPCGGF